MKSKKKGFTLIELIIVLTIMGILIAIIVPSWGYFMRRSKERTANSKAKVVFNAAQTEVTRIAQRERSRLSLTDAVYNTDTAIKKEAVDSLYLNKGTDFYFYWNGSTGSQINNDGTITGIIQKPHENVLFANAINNICGTEGTYKIHVRDYNVVSVVYCSRPDGEYKGTYPRSMGSDQIASADERTIRTTEVSLVDMSKIAL
ncbi:Tfp pilus assembly protein FimT/FimU [Ruminococcus flavefaciens]|uniref:pilus assembly FimT family protein n=1 Tax=Ruminococcus flavefaciens TaxID=1265 RepID=UPI0026EFCE82|nr:type II secretion system protein [Ruminococcus flavefaciens]